MINHIQMREAGISSALQYPLVLTEPQLEKINQLNQKILLLVAMIRSAYGKRFHCDTQQTLRFEKVKLSLTHQINVRNNMLKIFNADPNGLVTGQDVRTTLISIKTTDLFARVRKRALTDTDTE